MVLIARPGKPRARTVVSIGSIITVAFMGSVLVTPLYSLYEQAFGFSEITLTLVYAVYVVGNVVALLIFGQISDQLGRLRAALPALVLAAASALVFMFATGTSWLFAGRALIGVAVGVASGTGTAWLAEEFGRSRRSTATLAAATANLIGIALGPLVGGLLAAYAPHPLVLPFIVYIAALLGVGVAISRLPESHRPQVTRLSDVRIRPRIGVPSELRRAFLAPAITGFTIFSLGGLYFALIPTVIIRDLHLSDVAIGGAVVSEFGLVATLGIVVGRRLPPHVAATSGLILILPAGALVVIAQAVGSLPVLLVATAFGATALALGYRGSLQVINEMAPDDRRAELVSSYYIACFAGNSVPVIGLGVLSTITRPVVGSTVFAAVIAALAAAALVSRGRTSARGVSRRRE